MPKKAWIDDPWRRHRQGAALTPESAAKSAAESKPEAEAPRRPETPVPTQDRDLQPHSEFLLRVPGAPRALRILGVGTMLGAVERLHYIISSLPGLKKELEKLDVTLEAPPAPGAYFMLRTKNKVITVAGVKSAAEGFSTLTGGFLIAMLSDVTLQKKLQTLGVEMVMS